MLYALRQISLRHFAAHKLRTFLTMFGVALGVAAMVGIWIVNDSAARSFEDAIDRIAGKAQLQITSNGPVGVPEALVEEVKAVSGVDAAAPSVQGFVPVASAPGERLYVVGVDMLADRKIRDYEFGSSTSEASLKDALVFLAQPDSVALTAAFMRSSGLEVGGRIRLAGASGPAGLTIRGSLEVRKGPATLFGGRVALMDIFAAERLFGLDHRYTQIDVGLKPGAKLATVETSLTRLVGARAMVDRPRTRGKVVERLMAANGATFSGGASTAIILGLYLIFNTMMIAVAQRRRELGILRATGMLRREILGLIVFEALGFALVGYAVGVPLGVALARVMMPTYSAGLSGRISSWVAGGRVVVQLGPLIASLIFVVVSALIAALIPAREALNVQPVAALRSRALQDAHSPTYQRAGLTGASMIVVALVLWFKPRAFGLDPGAAVGWALSAVLIGVSLLAPALVRALAVRVERRLDLNTAPLGALAGRSVVAGLRRVSITSAALAVSIMAAVSLASTISSMEKTIDRIMYLVFSGADFVLFSGGSTVLSAGARDWLPLPGVVSDQITASAEVAHISRERWSEIRYQGLPTTLAAQDREAYLGGLRKIDLLEGDFASAIDALGRGEVLVSDVFAHRYDKHLDHDITLDTPAGKLRLRVAGVFYDAADLGIIYIDRSFYRRLWGDDRINLLQVALKPGVNRDAAIERIRGRWGDPYGLTVLSTAQIRRDNQAALAQGVAAAYPLVAIMIAIALLGVVNSLVASLLDRVREIGLLRATVATRAEVARIVVIEAAIIGLAGGALGVAGGSLLGYLMVGGVFPNAFGFIPLYRYPTGPALFVFVAAIALSAAAGYLPGRAAARLKIVEALAYE